MGYDVKRDRDTLEKWRKAPLQRPGEHVLDDTRRNREIKECSAEALVRWPAALDEIEHMRNLLRMVMKTECFENEDGEKSWGRIALTADLQSGVEEVLK